MELGFVNLPGLVVAIILIILALILYSVYCQSALWRLPGPKPTLYLGSLMSFIKKGVFGFDLENVRKYGKIYRLFVGNLPFVIVSDVVVMEQICIKEFSKYPNTTHEGSNDPMMDGALALARDERWKFLRSTLSTTFTSGKLKQMVPLLEKCTDDLVNKLKEDTEKGTAVEVGRYCDAYTMDVIASTVFGMDVDAQNNQDSAFIKHSKKVFAIELSNPFLILVLFFPFMAKILPYFKVSTLPKESCTFIRSALESVIAGRKSGEQVRHDFLGLILNAHKESENLEESIASDSRRKFEFKKRPLTNKEVMANAFVFFSGGYETTANVLSFIMYCLAVYPEYASKVRNEVDQHIGKEKTSYDNVMKLEYLDMFVCEVLRLYSSLPRINRVTDDDVVLKGYEIPKGIDIQFPVCAIHRDSELWPEPEIFDPERFTAANKANRHPCAWIPFGVGPRSCMGKRFALTILKLGTVAIIQNFDVLRCDETEVPITIGKNVFIKAANGIKLKFERRD